MRNGNKTGFTIRAGLIAVAILCRCGGVSVAQTDEAYKQLGQIVSKVREAIAEIELDDNGNSSDIIVTKIKLTLRGQTTKTAGGKFSIVFFKVGGSVKAENEHELSLTLKPVKRSRSKNAAGALADAIRSVRYASLLAQSDFSFSEGSATIKFTVEKDGNVSVANLFLKPIEIDADAKNSLVQTIELTFGMKQ